MKKWLGLLIISLFVLGSLFVHSQMVGKLTEDLDQLKIKFNRELDFFTDWSNWVERQLGTTQSLLMQTIKKVEKEVVILPIEPVKPVGIVDLIPQVISSVVHIKCPQWQGSGFVISPDTIMTARHCIEGVEDFVITTNNGHKLKATRAISSKKYDIAFIKIDDLRCTLDIMKHGPRFNSTFFGYEHLVELKPVKFGSIKDCKLGQQLFAIGSSYGKPNFNSVTLGIISGLDRDWDEIDPYTGENYGWSVAFTTDAAGHPGNSGCPIFTMDGKVRGVLVGGYSPVLISCMPVDLVLEDIEEIEQMFVENEYRIEEVPVYDAYGPPYDGDY